MRYPAVPRQDPAVRRAWRETRRRDGPYRGFRIFFCRECCFKLTASPLCRRNFSVSGMPVAIHGKAFAVSEPAFAVRNRLTAKMPDSGSES
jgi:hypothetical protein